MPPSARTRALLAAADRELVRQPGAAGDAERRRILAGSRVAVISPGYEGKRFMYERARELGVELVLVGEPEDWSRELRWSRGLLADGIAVRFVEFEPSGDPDETAAAIVEALGEEATTLDGLVTFWEDSVPATMRAAQALGLPGSPPAAADAARSKQRTLATSRAAGIPTADFVRLDGLASLAGAAARIGFPAVLKPALGASQLGCLKVDDLADLEAAFATVSALLAADLDPIFEQGTDLLLVEYLDGREFDVDIVLAGGECVFSTVSENWPTDEPYLAENGVNTPASCSPAERAELVDLSVRTAMALGFSDAALHTESKYTSRGPRLIEVNARLAGGRIVEFHEMVTGVDLIEIVFLTAVGIPVAPLQYERPMGGVAAAWLHAPRSGVLRGTAFLDHLATDEAVFQADVTAVAGDVVTAVADGFPTNIAEICVRAADMPSALVHLQAIVAALDVPIDPVAAEDSSAA